VVRLPGARRLGTGRRVRDFLDGTATITSKAGWKWTDVVHDLVMHLADVAHQTTVFVGGTVDDILEAHRSGRIPATGGSRASATTRFGG
jgi:membrane dipeptidase